MRYYKPDEYSFNEQEFNKIKNWNDLFVELVNLYAIDNKLVEGRFDFIDSGTRPLLIMEPNSEERKIRKKLKGGFWLLTNFDSKHLSKFCFNLAEKLNLKLRIKLRPTEFRKKKKFKKC